MVRNEANLLDFQSTIPYSLPETNGVKYAEPYSSITLDFGKEVCGPVTIQSGPTTTLQTAAFAYAESSQWVGFDSDDASSLRSSVVDGSFEFQIGPNQTYTVPIEKQRGGYRYLTIFPKTRDAILEIKGISAYFTSMPHWQNLRAYPSYFFCNDELLNRLWYASAYTNQLATLAKDQSRRCDLDSGSTMLEAWGGNGEITYPFYAEKPSYISHCHPFSTGPALVLTFEVLGLNFTDAGGRCWDFKPSPGDLEHCEGGFTGAYGKYSAGWKKIRENGRITFSCWVQAPEGTIGRVRMPVIANGWPNAIVEEKSLENETKNGYRWLDGVVGGERHKFIV
jgi:hypothetical protein